MVFDVAKDVFNPDSYQNEELERSFQRVQDGFKSLGDITDGALLESVSIGTSATTINTTLGRPWLGFVVMAFDAAATVYADSTERTSLVLTASAAITANIWVF